MTARMLREGTARLSSAEFAEAVEILGASLHIPVSHDYAAFSLFSLKKYARESLAIFAEMLESPRFDPADLQNVARLTARELEIELAKPEVLTYRALTERLFGANHPYGYNTQPDELLEVRVESLREHWRQFYRADNGALFVCGDLGEGVTGMLEDAFGRILIGEAPSLRPALAPAPLPDLTPIHIPVEGATQTSVKMGRRLFGRNHPDYNDIFVLNTALGGYFGSRLMSRIREKKGYTYNIYSSLDAMRDDGYWYIATEVSPGNVKQTIRDIRREMRLLQEELIGEKEMTMLRNYIAGALMHGIDGPLNTLDVLRAYIMEDLAPEAYETLARAALHANAARLCELAQHWLNPDDFVVVTAG